jgi:hypothetical protein
MYAIRLRRERDAKERAAKHRARIRNLLSMKRASDQVFRIADILRRVIDQAAWIFPTRVAGLIVPHDMANATSPVTDVGGRSLLPSIRS